MTTPTPEERKKRIEELREHAAYCKAQWESKYCDMDPGVMPAFIGRMFYEVYEKEMELIAAYESISRREQEHREEIRKAKEEADRFKKLLRRNGSSSSCSCFHRDHTDFEGANEGCCHGPTVDFAHDEDMNEVVGFCQRCVDEHSPLDRFRAPSTPTDKGLTMEQLIAARDDLYATYDPRTASRCKNGCMDDEACSDCPSTPTDQPHA